MASRVDLRYLEHLVGEHLPADIATVKRLHKNFPKHTVVAHCRTLLLKYEPLCPRIEMEEKRCRDVYQEIEPDLHLDHDDDVYLVAYARVCCDDAIRYVDKVIEFKKRLAQLGQTIARAIK